MSVDALVVIERSELGLTLCDQAIAACVEQGWSAMPPELLVLRDWLEERGLQLSDEQLSTRLLVEVYNRRLCQTFGLSPTNLRGPAPEPLTLGALFGAMTRYEVETRRRPDRFELHPEQLHELQRELSRQPNLSGVNRFVDSDRGEEYWTVFGMRIVPNRTPGVWRIYAASASSRTKV